MIRRMLEAWAERRRIARVRRRLRQVSFDSLEKMARTGLLTREEFRNISGRSHKGEGR